MPSPKYTKIEITPEAYLALEAEAILRSKTLKKLASELILEGASKESLDFAERASTLRKTETDIKFNGDKMAKAAKAIGVTEIKIDKDFLEAIQKKLRDAGYMEAMLYVIQHTASIKRDELQRVLTICQYNKLPPKIAAEIIVNLNNLESVNLG
jgi:hypothetical protein